MVKAKLLKLEMNKAPGVDLVRKRMSTKLAKKISCIVAELFNKALLSFKKGFDKGYARLRLR